jgi:phosphoenolpyruvate---glycerone phosphotransferase subunit DhaL
MLNSLSLSQTRDMLIYVSQQMISNQDYLNKADREIGDGDHGNAMTRGFEKVIELFNEKCPENIADLFLSIGNEFLSSVGGTSGIIFSTFFRSGSKALINKQDLDSAGIADFLQFSLDAIMKRGGAKPGDKTMIDALEPAVIEARKMKTINITNALKSIADSAFAGMEKTKLMKANIGRAKTYGDTNLGNPDPGAITTYLILRFMSDFVNNLQNNS